MKADDIGCLGSFLGLVGLWAGVFMKNPALFLLGVFVMVVFFLLAYDINRRNNAKK